MNVAHWISLWILSLLYSVTLVNLSHAFTHFFLVCPLEYLSASVKPQKLSFIKKKRSFGKSEV